MHPEELHDQMYTVHTSSTSPMRAIGKYASDLEARLTGPKGLRTHIDSGPRPHSSQSSVIGPCGYQAFLRSCQLAFEPYLSPSRLPDRLTYLP
jgi:hypothetical protein